MVEFVKPEGASEDEILRQHEGFVRQVVGYATKNLPHYVDRDPLLNAGRVGFVDALRRYDAEYNTSFRSYATTRIRGAVFDELRRTDSHSRRQHTKRDDLERLRAAMAARLQRDVSDEEVLDSLNVTGIKRQKYAVLFYQDCILSTEEMHEIPGEDSRPDHLAEAADMHDVVLDGVAQLSDSDQLVLAMIYLDGESLERTAKFFGVTESRICQRRIEIILKLRRLCKKQFGFIARPVGKGW